MTLAWRRRTAMESSAAPTVTLFVKFWPKKGCLFAFQIHWNVIELRPIFQIILKSSLFKILDANYQDFFWQNYHFTPFSPIKLQKKSFESFLNLQEVKIQFSLLANWKCNLTVYILKYSFNKRTLACTRINRFDLSFCHLKPKINLPLPFESCLNILG